MYFFVQFILPKMHLASHQVQSTGSKWLQMAPNGSKWLQMASNYSKWFQMTMAEANGYGNGPTLSKTVPYGPKWSKMVQNYPQ